MRQATPFRLCLAALSAVILAACAQTVRRSGQVEMFGLTDAPGSDGGRIGLPVYRHHTAEVSIEQARMGPDARVDARFGDLVRFPTDTITITVPTVYLDHLPATLSSATTGRYDAMLFAEVWENGAVDRSEPSLNRIVHVALDQHIPGRLNFSNAIAYGPTYFKGHPLRIKFTLVLLQKRAKQHTDTAAKSLQDFISVAGAGTAVGPAASTVIGLIRQVVKSLPDVEAFDFEATLLPFRPPVTQEAGASPGFVARSLYNLAEAPSIPQAKALGRELEALVYAKVREPYAGLQETARHIALAAGDGTISADRLAEVKALASRTVGPQESSSPMLASLNALPARETTAEQLQESIDALVGERAALAMTTKYLKVQKGAAALRTAGTTAEVVEATRTITACADYSAIAPLPLNADDLIKEMNARPWFRYGMFMLAETLRHRGMGRSVSFPVDGKMYSADRIAMSPVLPSESSRPAFPNFVVIDIIPGLTAVDETVLKATSDAAQRMFDLYGYTPTRRLIENPQLAVDQIQSIGDELLESIVRAKGRQLALELARDQEADKKDRSEPFKESGGDFEAKFDEMVEGLDLKRTEEPDPFAGIRDSLRKEFWARFR